MHASCSSLRLFLMVALALLIASLAIARPGMTTQSTAIDFGKGMLALKMG